MFKLLILTLSLVQLKDNQVSLETLSPQMTIATLVACSVYQAHQKACVITSGDDGTHKHGSHHYTGNALDFRTRHLTPTKTKTIYQQIKHALKQHFDVILEKTHIHIEYDPKPNANA